MSHNRGKGEAIKWLRKHASYDGDDCLIWPFCQSNGYGVVYDCGEAHYAHRLICKWTHGEPPSPKHHAAHSCGRGHQGCITPKHLSWKTPSENQLDRQMHDTKNIWGGRGKLTFEQAEEIRALKGRKPQREIAKLYGISRSQVSWIITGKSHAGKLKGVHPAGKKWTARIKINRCPIHLGTFDTEHAARMAYQQANDRVRAGLPVLAD